MKVRLFGGVVLESHAWAKRCAHCPSHAAVGLNADTVRIDGEAGIDDDVHARDTHRSAPQIHRPRSRRVRSERICPPVVDPHRSLVVDQFGSGQRQGVRQMSGPFGRIRVRIWIVAPGRSYPVAERRAKGPGDDLVGSAPKLRGLLTDVPPSLWTDGVRKAPEQTSSSRDQISFTGRPGNRAAISVAALGPMVSVRRPKPPPTWGIATATEDGWRLRRQRLFGAAWIPCSADTMRLSS